jgi:mannosyltransferase
VKALRPLLLIIAVAAVLRVLLAARQDLWADELFSLAIATGHSLEHPASAAVPALGDFVEPPAAVRPADFRKYLAHESPPAGPKRVLRAVLLSDTSPPLYYLGLAVWTRILGVTDFSVHGFSVFWSLATMPLIWLIGRRLAGAREALIACVLFTLAPMSLYYSVEGRMYSMLWFLGALTVWLTLRSHDRGGTAVMISWAVVSAAGLLTHYFYVFVWAACVLWLLFRPGSFSRAWLVGAVLAAVLLVAPWYSLVPASLAQWRVTGDWLDGIPPAGKLIIAPLTLGWSLLSGRGVWGGVKAFDTIGTLLVLALGLALLRRGRGGVIGGGRDLLWLWVIAACAGPVVFDLLRQTSTSLISRYALPGLPAALLLTAIAIGSLPPRLGLGALLLLVGTWSPGLRDIFRQRARAWEPYRPVAARVGNWAGPRDLLVVHSIPSGVLGVARYLPRDVPMAAWVGQLGNRRVPQDLGTLLQRRDRIALIRIHEVGEPAPEEEWLRAHATVLREERRDAAVVVYFAVPPTLR